MLPRKTNFRILFRRPDVFIRLYWPALLILLGGAVLDAATTYPLLRDFGPEAELHPVMSIMAALCGPALAVTLGTAIKLAITVLVASLWRPWCRWLMIAAGFLYALAAVSNHYLLL